MTFTIDRNKFKTEMGKKLYDRLSQISEDINFLAGVFFDLPGDERKKKFMDLLDKTGMNTVDEILDYLDEHEIT